MASISLLDLRKQFHDHEAVKQLTLDIADGEFMVLVGPSGCGKSTILRMIAGLEEPTSGEIFIGGEPVVHLEPHKRNVAMVFQSYALYPHKNVFENLAFSLKLATVRQQEIKERVGRVAEMLDLTPLLLRKPKELSGGQKQRVALGRAVIREPAAFLMDEPLSNLDAQLRTRTRAELLKLHRTLHTTTIYVTHDQVEAMTLGERVAIMRDGVIQQVDSPKNVYSNPANRFVAGFLGNPGMNFLDARFLNNGSGPKLTGNGFSLSISTSVADRLAPWKEKEVVVGVRPEAMVVSSPDKSLKVDLEVEVVEPLGAETLVHCKIGVEDLLIRESSDFDISPGQTLTRFIPYDRLYLFEQSTEARIL